MDEESGRLFIDNYLVEFLDKRNQDTGCWCKINKTEDKKSAAIAVEFYGSSAEWTYVETMPPKDWKFIIVVSR